MASEAKTRQTRSIISAGKRQSADIVTEQSTKLHQVNRHKQSD